MSIFGLLRGGKKPIEADVVPDRLWMTTDAKFAGLDQEVANSAYEVNAVLLVAHFPDVLSRLEEVAERYGGFGQVKAVIASKLDMDFVLRLTLDGSPAIHVIVGERHPSASVDERLDRFVTELPYQCRLSHHLSLEDPVLKGFASQWAQGVLRKIGMKEDESIESRLVSKRIKRRQQEISDGVVTNYYAASAAEWMRANCPQLSHNEGS